MAPNKVQVLGLTRWSIPFWSDGFRRASDSLESLRAELYAPHRLDHRLFLLEHVILPCLRAQTDPDFTHILLLGDELPDPWRSRIMELTADTPQIKTVFRPEGLNHKDTCREVLQEHVDPECEAVAQYRLDDDDGLAAAFVEKTRSYYSQMRPIFQQHGELALDFCRGFILHSSEDGFDPRPVSMRFWAPGMVIFLRPDSEKALLDFSHLRVWHSMPTMVMQDRPMYFRGAHHDNDSQLASFGRRTRGFRFNPPQPQRYFLRRFGIDLENMNSLWAEQQAYFLGGGEQKATAKKEPKAKSARKSKKASPKQSA